MKGKKMLCIVLSLLLTVFIAGCTDLLPGGKDLDKLPDVSSEISDLIDIPTFITKTANPLTDNAEDLVDNEIWKNHVSIECGKEITVKNDNPSEITIDIIGNSITVTSLKKMTLTLKGTLDGKLTVIKPDGKLKLVLDGITINSPFGSAINLITEKRNYIVLNKDTTNILTDKVAETFADSSESTAAIQSKEQIIISGDGTLNVTGSYKHAIASRDYVRIINGKINLTAKSDGLHGKDAIIIDGGELSISAESDGIESDNGYVVINGGYNTITAKGDGICTTYSGIDTLVNPYIAIENGITLINASREGLSANSSLNVNGGFTTIKAANDALNAARKIAISDGYLLAESEKDDAVDCNGEIQVSGGTIVALGAATPAEGFDTNGNTFSITGGTVIAAAGAMALPTEAACTQGVIIYGGNTENVLLRLQSKDVANFAVCLKKTYATILLSSPSLKPNSYSLLVGGICESKSFYGLFLAPICSGGTVIKEFITTSNVTVLSGKVKNT